jgi:hypothetical protein
LLAWTPPRNGRTFRPVRLGNLSAKTHAALGASAILLGLALVPAIWGCGEGVSGWNVLIFGLIALGASWLGSAVGRSTGQRLLGIAMTVLAVLAALFLVGVITAGTC